MNDNTTSYSPLYPQSGPPTGQQSDQQSGTQTGTQPNVPDAMWNAQVMPQQVQPRHPLQPRQRRRGTMVAGVLAASLIFGGAAGVGAAAAWDTTRDDAGSSGSNDTVVNSSVDPDSSTPIAATDGSVQEVADSVLPSVVRIDMSNGQESGSGSGIIISSDGQILTNNHVAEVGEGGTLTISFNDGTRAEATILGTDPLTDTAVIKAENVSGLTPAKIGTSDALQVGQDVVAIGSPFGLDATVTSGIVSALNRPVSVGADAEGNSTTYPAIQTDAAINPGNSGGPLVDRQGRVVGINSSIRTSGEGSEAQGGSIGLGFAIPIDDVMPLAKQMANGETPTHARLGVTVRDAVESGSALTSGAQVQEVTSGSKADEAGLESGDVITAIDGQHIGASDALVATVRSYRPGESVKVTYQRDGEEDTATLELGSDAS